LELAQILRRDAMVRALRGRYLENILATVREKSGCLLDSLKAILGGS
jgi:hypothetical protein